MKKYRVEIQHGTTTHCVVVPARNYEEAVEEAARVIHFTDFPVEATVREAAVEVSQ